MRTNGKFFLLFLAFLFGFLFVLAASAQDFRWRPFHSGKEGIILEGNWQSCLEDDGDYTERAFEYRSSYNQPVSWTLHMGPHDEFALFAGRADEHIPHDSPQNLLGPAFHIHDLSTYRGARTWSALGLWVSIVEAGGSRDECDSFFVLVEKLHPNAKVARGRP